MTAAMVLVVYAATVAVFVPGPLRRAAWVLRAPRLAVTAWYAVVLSVAASLELAAGILLVAPARTWDAVCELFRLCAKVLGAGHGWMDAVVPVGTLLVVVAVGVRLALAAVRTIVPSTRGRQDHARSADLFGRRLNGLGATVVEHDTAAAYLVPGRSARIVVTSAAVEMLNDAELAAVVAHERGHQTGHHHVLVDGMRVLARAFGRSYLIACARAQVALLVEVCADDAAAARHARVDLARALVTMAEARSVDSGVLAASGGDATIRVRRLLDPPRPLSRARRVVLATGLAALTVVPVAVTALAWVWPVLLDCPIV